MIKAVQHIFKGVIDFFYPFFSSLMSKQLFRYAFCGAFAVFVDILIFFMSYNFLFNKQNVYVGQLVFKAETAALASGFVVSAFTGFFLQKYITFTNSNLRGRVQLFRYFVIVIICLLLNYYGIMLLVSYNVFPTLAKIIVTPFVITFSYFSQRYFSFQEKNL